jgi:hypothetical protein
MMRSPRTGRSEPSAAFIGVLVEVWRMALTVETPTPPDLTNRPLPSDVDPADVLDGSNDLRREELEEALQDGAWSEGFQEWAAYTDLTEEEYHAIYDHGLLDRLDFYWDPTTERLRYAVPAVTGALADDDLAARAESELDDLGRTVVEQLADAYLDWGETDAGEADWSEETFGDESPLED